MKKAKRFNDGGMSLEEMYPEAKITRAGAQPKPEEYSANRFKVGESDWESSQKSNRADNRTLAPYERKAPAMGKGGGGGGGGAGADLEMSGMLMRRPKPTLKAGGKVKSASSRADGIAIRGKTRA